MGEKKAARLPVPCSEDLMEAGPLQSRPSLPSFLRLTVMDELCARHIHRTGAALRENNHENERNGHRKTGVRPLAAFSRRWGKGHQNRHQACPVCGGSDRFRFDDKEGRGTWFCNQCGAGDGLKLVESVQRDPIQRPPGGERRDRQTCRRFPLAVTVAADC